MELSPRWSVAGLAQTARLLLKQDVLKRGQVAPRMLDPLLR